VNLRSRILRFLQGCETHDFIQDGRIELDGKLPLNTFAAASARDASTASGTSSKARYRHRVAPGSRQVKDANVSFVGAPIVTGTTFIFISDPLLGPASRRRRSDAPSHPILRATVEDRLGAGRDPRCARLLTLSPMGKWAFRSKSRLHAIRR